MVTPGFQLIIQQGPTPGLVYDLVKPEIMIGRDMTNDFVVNDPEVSRKHALLRLEGGSYVIEDQGSTNGTFVNGQRLMGPHSLNAGELITLGENIKLQFEAIRPDLAATMLSGQANSYPPAPGGYSQVPQQPPSQQVYVLPPKPAAQAYVAPPAYQSEEFIPEPIVQKNSQGLWLMAGCGCIVLVAITCAAAALSIDYFNLWCTLFGWIIPGC